MENSNWKWKHKTNHCLQGKPYNSNCKHFRISFFIITFIYMILQHKNHTKVNNTHFAADNTLFTTQFLSNNVSKECC